MWWLVEAAIAKSFSSNQFKVGNNNLIRKHTWINNMFNSFHILVSVTRDIVWITNIGTQLPFSRFIGDNGRVHFISWHGNGMDVTITEWMGLQY